MNVNPSVWECVHLSLCLLLSLSLCLDICQPICVSVCLFACLSVSVCLCLSLCVCLSLSVSPDLSLSLHLFYLTQLSPLASRFSTHQEPNTDPGRVLTAESPRRLTIVPGIGKQVNHSARCAAVGQDYCSVRPNGHYSSSAPGQNETTKTHTWGCLAF